MAISEVYRALWRHRLFVALVTAAVVVAAFVFTSRQTELYTASSLVRVQQNVRNSEEAFGALLTGERLARTYEQIAETDSVEELVEQQMGSSFPPFVKIEAAQVSNLELLEISVTDASPRAAAAVANAVPTALATFIKRTGSFRDTISVVERAAVPKTPSSPNLKLNLVLALLLGLILACGLALLREGLSDRIEGVEELERVAGYPVIAIIPNLKFQPVVTPQSRGSGGRRLGPVPTTTARVKKVESGAEAASRWSARG
jgi:polysaccharide biosynthesis transport protein